MRGWGELVFECSFWRLTRPTESYCFLSETAVTDPVVPLSVLVDRSRSRFDLGRESNMSLRDTSSDSTKKHRSTMSRLFLQTIASYVHFFFSVFVPTFVFGR